MTTQKMSLQETIEKILLMEPLYVKPGLSKKKMKEIEVIHKRDEILRVIDETRKEERQEGYHMDNEEIKAFKEKLRNICTYHTDDGTSGYELSNERFTQIEDMFLEIMNKVRSDYKEQIENLDREMVDGAGWNRMHELVDRILYFLK
jgi:hypothetical protein